MRLLLDTHAFVWSWLEDAALHRRAANAIRTADVVYVSLASAWEIEIARSVGRLDLGERVEAAIEASGFTALTIRFSHIDQLAALPFHHRDPFDRMLIAQAMAEGLTLVTRDRHFARYGVALIRA